MDIRATAKGPASVLKLYGLDIKNASAAPPTVASPEATG
jgi:hypothetical protein